MANQLQEQVSTIWKKTSPAQKITVITLILAVVGISVGLVAWAQKPSYAIAFSGLSDSDSSSITQKLDEEGISYQLKGTGTILVPSSQVYTARLAMASAGLPQDSTVGYELFSSNTLGMTEFAQQVNYQRALEGELERTISSLDAVDSVKVNVVTPEKALLTTEQTPATASVMIKVKAGDSLDSAQVKAITHLVAYSVEGLDPSNVVVVDANGNLLSNGSDSDQEALVAQSDSQHAAEIAAANEITNKVQDLLNTILGPNRAAVQANVVMDWSQKEVTSNVYDPTQTALLSAQRTFETSGSGTTTSGIPGATSNVATTPQATTTAVATTSTTGSGAYSSSSETYNYQVSQTQTHEVTSTGTIKNISLAVMVDQVTDQTQLDMIKAAVTAAAGIDTTRGDTISVNTIAFDRTYYTDQATALDKADKTALYEKIGIGVGAGILLLVLFLYFSKVMKNLRMASSSAWKPIQLSVANGAIGDGGTGVIHSLPADNSASPIVNIDSMKKNDSRSSSQNSAASKAIQEDEQRARVISRLTEENPATVAEIIQIWLSEDEKNHGG